MKLNAKAKYLIYFLLISFYILCLLFAIFKKTSIDTDLISLIKDSKFPIQKIFNKKTNYINIIFENTDQSQAINTAELFYSKLDKSIFKNIKFKISKDQQSSILKTLEKYRYNLLSYDDRILLDQNRFEDIRIRAFDTITGSIVPDLIDLDKDPFLLFTNYIQSLFQTQGLWSIQNEYLVASKDDKNYILMIINMEDIELHQISNIFSLSKELSTIDPSTHIYTTGTPIHSYISMKDSKFQINIFVIISFIVVLFFIWSLLKDIKLCIPIFINIAISFCGAYCFLLFFKSIHILTFVFATSLIGLSIDYSFHFLSTSRNNYKKLTINMLKAYITTITCFSPLLFSSLSVLNQIALFTVIGLSINFINVIVFYPMIKQKYYNSDRSIRVLSISKKYLFIPSLIIILLGIFNVHIKTDITSLYKPKKDILNAEKLYSNLSDISKSKLLVVEGRSIDLLLEEEEKIKENNSDFFSLSSIVPSLKMQDHNFNKVSELIGKEFKNLEKDLGTTFKLVDVKKSFLSIDLIKDLVDPFLVYTDSKFYSLTPIVIDQDNNFILTDNSTILDTSNYLNNVLETYTKEIYKYLSISFIVLSILLSLFYKKRFLLYLIPSFLSILTVVSILSICNINVNLFHLLSLFIVLGVGLDYTIFMLSGYTNRAVLFSFLSSFIGFGLLSFTSFGIISSMGIVLALGLLFSFIYSFFERV